MLKIFLALTASCIIAAQSQAAAQTQSPWLNTNVIGAMKAAKYSPALKDDFYANVNAEWLTAATLKPGYPRTGAFMELQDEIDARLKGLMTDTGIPGHDAELVRRLYSMWLDWDSRNAEGLADLDKQASRITGIKTLAELSAYFMEEETLYSGEMLADFGIGRDNKDSESYNLELSATGLSLGDSAEYTRRTANGGRVKKMHDGIVRYMLRRLGYDETFAGEMLERSYRFEEKIAASEMTLAELYDPSAVDKMYNPLTMDELREKSPAFPFADILVAHNAVSDLINLQEPGWLKALNGLYTESNLEDMKAYLLCNLVKGYITLTDEAAYREYQRLSRERLGITASKPDDELAVDFVHDRLPVCVSRIYVGRYVPEEAKNEVSDIIRRTVKYYRSMLEAEDWLSEPTRRKAVEKLDAMRLNSAYPEKWVDYSEYEIADGMSLFDAVKALRKYNVQKYFYDRLNQKVDHDLWIQDVIVVNAYYQPSENSINIIAGIMGGDFYSPEMSYEEKLGGIGMVIGHEVSHAFDTSGAQFGKTGNVESWWTDEDKASFKARADRLIKYLDTFRVDDSGEHYSGSLVQTETIADMAGVKAMLGIAEGRKDFDYDKFFRSYAKIWKVVQTRELNDARIRTDVHALPYIRVNAIVQQYADFYRTYGISDGDGMYLAPENRVAVW
ncbi:MAG: M13 family metallopeptidase [Synergistaceae bacterium]|nr:M13 family metallopeptidase [Synergistaceae bacterium]